MTDIPPHLTVPTRLGVSARMVDGELVLDCDPQPEALHRGVVRASVVSFVVDALAGILVDDDPGTWSFTTDLSLRMRPVPAPARLTGRNTVLRRGRRSATCMVDVTDGAGALVATGSIGFARVPRRPSDPPKPPVTPERVAELMHDLGTLTAPLREEAGIEVVDAADGVVEVLVTPDLRNPAGTLQGAMVALVAEAAVEDLVEARFGAPAVVCELDLRYLAQARQGPVRSRCRLLGDDEHAPVEVTLIDISTDATTTVAYARAAPVG